MVLVSVGCALLAGLAGGCSSTGDSSSGSSAGSGATSTGGSNGVGGSGATAAGTATGGTATGGVSSGSGGGGAATGGNPGTAGSGGVTNTGGSSTGGNGGAAPGDRSPDATCARWKTDTANLAEGTWSGSVDSCMAGDISADGKAQSVKVEQLTGNYGNNQAIRIVLDGWKAVAGTTYAVSVTGTATPIAYEIQLIDCK